jgi:ATPase subunit of ABC transporter with duplicated ATPase domains
MADHSPNSIVSASELVVRYGVQTVLDHATLTIHGGERVGLVGRNGSGKSTFLQIAAGTLKPDTVNVFGGVTSPPVTCRRRWHSMKAPRFS